MIPMVSDRKLLENMLAKYTYIHTNPCDCNDVFAEFDFIKKCRRFIIRND